MDNATDNPDHLSSPASTSADVNLLQAQLEALGSMVVSVLILLIVLAATFDLYLVRQIKDTRSDLPGLRNNAMIMQRQGGAVDAFIGKLADYGRTHQDFGPIMTKYNLPRASALPTAMPAPAAAPVAAPAPAPASKK